MPVTIKLILEVIEIPVLQRLLIASLFPNILVLGFKANNLDSERNRLI